MPLPTVVGGEHYVQVVRLAVRQSGHCLLTPILRDAIFPYLVEVLKGNFPQIITIWVRTNYWKCFPRSWKGQMWFSGWGI